ncbi:MAG: metal ABC transporter ATP-binding protein [Deltaproteobacteria bacterium]|jgi:zinc transport system ATP-binding protein|nr:metal ABC transporter ATP-binding protein [Deltaproteobacteria bacterium]
MNDLDAKASAAPGTGGEGQAAGGKRCPCCAAAAKSADGAEAASAADTADGAEAAAAGRAASGRPALGWGGARDEEPAVAIRRLGVSVGRYDILKNVSLTVPPRRQTVVIGPNGAGKSTLVKAVLGQIDHSGEISYSPARPRFGYVPQRLDYDRHLPITVSEFMSLGRSRWPVWLGTPRRVREESMARLSLVKAEHLYARPLGSLSGGESQRVFLARALMEDPDILVLDEPATGVDVLGEQLLCEILEGFKSDFTVLMVSHDLAAARAHGDWIVCLNRTVVAEGPPSEIFRPEVISLAFGIHQSLLFSGGPGMPGFGPAAAGPPGARYAAEAAEAPGDADAAGPQVPPVDPERVGGPPGAGAGTAAVSAGGGGL